MPTTPDTTQRGSLPISHSYIADALAAHQVYLDQLQRWYDWLEDPAEPENALQHVLFKLIDDTIKRREPGGEWHNLPEEVEKDFPTAEALRDALDTAKYNDFELLVASLRQPIEKAALALTTILDSPEFIDEVNRLPYDEQLLYAEKLVDQLAGSGAGLGFLKDSINAPLQTPLPLFHPDRLLKQEGTFVDTKLPIMQRASQIYAHLLVELAPALLVEKDYRKFTDATLEFIAKYFPEDVVNALTLEEKVDNARQYLKKNEQQYLAQFGEPTVATISIFFEIVNVYLAANALQKDPSLRTTFGMLSAIASLTSTLASAHDKLKLPGKFPLSPTLVGRLNILIALHDVIINAIDAYDAWRTGDISVATGHVMQGVGIGAAVVAASLTAVGAAKATSPSIAINPVAGGFLTLGALLVTFAGTLVVIYTKDPPLERWVENSYFGDKWEDVTIDEPPTDILYGFKHVDGTPNLARQISEYLSMFYPIGLQLQKGLSEPNLVTLTLNKPALAFHESHIFVKRIDDAGYFGGSPRYRPIALYMKPINAKDDVAGGFQRNNYYPENPTEGQKLEEWFRVFNPLDLTQGTNPSFDPTGAHIEVDVTIPDKFQPALASIVLVEPEVMDKFPFVLRARARVD